ncbi:DUF1659 domain-containing protein [Desulfoscipio geothermicus]|uniref:DUF1659 domain-containing protein n=1 Tax=Desulfoscipio geothermicus DSM 3669 TaxID=1121426 RepID=A0A1I6DZW7_9FIRM|nr:DUF1659 domain-containing protein [Desulfoscipio geothermicus]SFR11050.1 Protein of unknown function [Desulfoscipio geothermicus DSM 3669]
MAVNNVATGTVLRMQFQTGVDANGDPVYRSKNLYNVKPQATDQDLFDVANALAQLQNYTLAAIMRIDSARLEEVVG